MKLLQAAPAALSLIARPYLLRKSCQAWQLFLLFWPLLPRKPDSLLGSFPGPKRLRRTGALSPNQQPPPLAQAERLKGGTADLGLLVLCKRRVTHGSQAMVS